MASGHETRSSEFSGRDVLIGGSLGVAGVIVGLGVVSGLMAVTDHEPKVDNPGLVVTTGEQTALDPHDFTIRISETFSADGATYKISPREDAPVSVKTAFQQAPCAEAPQLVDEPAGQLGCRVVGQTAVLKPQP